MVVGTLILSNCTNYMADDLVKLLLGISSVFHSAWCMVSAQ